MKVYVICTVVYGQILYISIQIPVLILFLKLRDWDEKKETGEVLNCEEGWVYLIHVLPFQRQKRKRTKDI